MAYVSAYTVTITLSKVGTYKNGWATGQQTHTIHTEATERDVAVARAALMMETTPDWEVTDVHVESGSGYYTYE